MGSMTAPSAEALLEKLSRPPIDEVVCGVLFDPLDGLDPLVIGTYWNERSAEYPGRELKPALVTPPDLPFGPEGLPRLRVWLIRRDEQFVIQIQSDRFYLNWRRRAETYPSFSGRGGNPGVLAEVLREYDEFSTFCKRTLKAEPVASRIELAKVDVLREGDDATSAWTDLEDLATMLPWLAPFAGFHVSGAPSFALRFDEPRAEGLLTVAIGLGALEEPGIQKRAVKIETRITKPCKPEGATIEAAFREANIELNRVFGSLIPKAQRDQRFNKGAT